MAELIRTEQAGQCVPRADRFPGEVFSAAASIEGANAVPAGQCASEAVRFPEGRPASAEPSRGPDGPQRPKG